MKKRLYAAQARFEKLAKAARFKVEYNGVGPTLVKGKYSYFLPD